jgi:hypothetical protein
MKRTSLRYALFEISMDCLYTRKKLVRQTKILVHSEPMFAMLLITSPQEESNQGYSGFTDAQAWIRLILCTVSFRREWRSLIHIKLKTDAGVEVGSYDDHME